MTRFGAFLIGFAAVHLIIEGFDDTPMTKGGFYLALLTIGLGVILVEVFLLWRSND